MQAPAPVRRSDNSESMLNLLSISNAVRRGSPQRRVNAGIPLDWARLYILLLLAGLMSVGCRSLPNIPPTLPGARLVPGSEDCRFVVRGDKAVWWGTGTFSYPEWVKTDPQSHGVLARASHREARFGASATGFEAVWSVEAGYDPSVYKFDTQVKLPPQKISLGKSWFSKGTTTHLAVGDHAVWATFNSFDKVFRIDPDTLAIVATLPVPVPTIVEAGEGAVWVFSRGKFNRKDLVRIDPETNRITATIPLEMYPYAIATGGGAVWVASGPRVIRVNPLTNRIEAAFQVGWDQPPADLNSVVQMVVAKETLWTLVFTQPRVTISQLFSYPDVVGDFALVEIDIKTNAIRTIRQLGSGEGNGQLLYSHQIFTVIDDDAWVCLPTGLYVIPITDTGHPDTGK